MRYLPLALMLVLLCSCTPQSGGNYDATYRQQLDDYDRQTATTERQLQQTQRQLDQTQKQLDQTQEQQDETERQLQRSKIQADRYDALLDRWEEQADRQDKVLDALERISSIQKTGSPDFSSRHRVITVCTGLQESGVIEIDNLSRVPAKIMFE